MTTEWKATHKLTITNPYNPNSPRNYLVMEVDREDGPVGTDYYTEDEWDNAEAAGISELKTDPFGNVVRMQQDNDGIWCEYPDVPEGEELWMWFWDTGVVINGEVTITKVRRPRRKRGA